MRAILRLPHQGCFDLFGHDLAKPVQLEVIAEPRRGRRGLRRPVDRVEPTDRRVLTAGQVQADERVAQDREQPRLQIGPRRELPLGADARTYVSCTRSSASTGLPVRCRGRLWSGSTYANARSRWHSLVSHSPLVTGLTGPAGPLPSSATPRRTGGSLHPREPEVVDAAAGRALGSDGPEWSEGPRDARRAKIHNA